MGTVGVCRHPSRRFLRAGNMLLLPEWGSSCMRIYRKRVRAQLPRLSHTDVPQGCGECLSSKEWTENKRVKLLFFSIIQCLIVQAYACLRKCTYASGFWQTVVKSYPLTAFSVGGIYSAVYGHRWVLFMTVQRGKDYLSEMSSQHHWKINFCWPFLS